MFLPNLPFTSFYWRILCLNDSTNALGVFIEHLLICVFRIVLIQIDWQAVMELGITHIGGLVVLVDSYSYLKTAGDDEGLQHSEKGHFWGPLILGHCLLSTLYTKMKLGYCVCKNEFWYPHYAYLGLHAWIRHSSHKAWSFPREEKLYRVMGKYMENLFWMFFKPSFKRNSCIKRNSCVLTL